MKKIVLLLLILGVFACGSTEKESKVPTTALKVAEKTALIDQEEMLLGEQTETALKKEPYASWFQPGYTSFEPSEEKIGEIKKLLSDKEIVLFLGTWCGDSQREVPHFFKILDEADFDKDNLRMITVDRNKTTPGNLEEGFNLINVPTMIFYENGKEMNRMVEYPIESLEEDMLKILKGETYKNPYAY